MTNSIVLRDYLPGLGVFQKTVMLKTPMRLPDTSQVRVQCSSVHMTTRIPNVFNALPFGVSFDNTILRVGTDTQPYQSIKLEPGLYQDGYILMQAINAAINNTLHWWNDSKDPGLILSVNDVLDRFIIKINSAKLNPLYGTVFKLDLRYSTTHSQMYQTLGFTDTTELIGDGIYTSAVVPRMDTQGTTAVVLASAMPVRLVNENYYPLVADVSFANTTTSTDIVWPPGGVISTMLVYSGPRTITQVTFTVQTTEGVPMLFLDGQLLIELGFYW